MRRRTGPDDDAGFTMVEVITGLAVITVVLAAATTFFIESMKTVNLQGQKQTAVQVATDRMEELRSLPGSDAYAWIAANASGTTIRNGLTYAVTWTCTDANSGSPCVGPPTPDSSTWTQVLQPQVTVTFQSKGCKTGGCVFTAKTQISTRTADPIFGA